MIKRLAISFAVLLFGTLALHGQVLQGIISDTHHSGGGGYTGPGDVKSGAVSFYSTVRAYNAAYATGSNPAYVICASSACGATQTVNILTSGLADVTTANAFLSSCIGGPTFCAVGAMANQIAASFGNFGQTSSTSQLPVYAATSFSSTYGAGTFNGTTNYFDRTTNQGPQTAYTNCAILNFADVGHVYVISEQFSGSQAYSQYFIGSDGSIHARIIADSGSTYIGRTTAASAASTGYHQYCFTWSGGTTAAAIKIYKGSTQVDTTDDNAGSFSAPNSNSIVFELGAQNGGALIKADIIEQMEWPVALSGGEITGICNTIPGGCI